MEIERKFLVASLPTPLSQYSSCSMVQGYLSFDPLVRIRKQGGEYYLTKKGKGHLIRTEEEHAISQQEYEELSAKVVSHLIYKTRYRIPLPGGLLAELDVYEERLSGLTVVEVEFPSLEVAEGFVPPPWFGDDVTFDKRYKNNHLSTLEALSDLK